MGFVFVNNSIRILFLDAQYGGLAIEPPLLDGAIAQIAGTWHERYQPPEGWGGGERNAKLILASIGVELEAIFNKDECSLLAEGQAHATGALRSAMRTSQKARLCEHWQWKDSLVPLDDSATYGPSEARLARALHASIIEQLPLGNVSCADFTMQNLCAYAT